MTTRELVYLIVATALAIGSALFVLGHLAQGDTSSAARWGAVFCIIAAEVLRFTCHDEEDPS